MPRASGPPRMARFIPHVLFAGTIIPAIHDRTACRLPPAASYVAASSGNSFSRRHFSGGGVASDTPISAASDTANAG